MADIWTAAIPAVAALAGVGLGQWLQGRRDAVLHRREREREERQRRHEDRRRFADEKRRAYAEFLAILESGDRWFDRLDEAADRGPVPPEFRLTERHPPYVTKQFEDEHETIYRKLGSIYMYIRLIAPSQVHQLAYNVWDGYDNVGINRLWGSSSPVDLSARREQLLSAMKTDLDGEQFPV